MKDIKSAKAIFFDSMVEKQLNPKGNSQYCLFFDEFEVGNGTVILRLDWGDLDKHGYPTLDADFYKINPRKQLKLHGERKTAHHTSTIEGAGRSYEWIFKECKLKFKVILTFSTSINEEIRMIDSCEAEVIRKK